MEPKSMAAENNITSRAAGSTKIVGALADWVSDWGTVTLDIVAMVGEFSVFAAQTISWMCTRRTSKATLLSAMYQVGVLSLPVVALTGAFIGMVLAVQSYFQFRQLGLETRLGGVINMSLVRELGPVLAATMLAGRVGSAMAAELGTMRVTEQIDALDSMGANPIRYLVVPRLIACALLIPPLTVMADFMGVIGGYFYSIYLLDIDSHHYWFNAREFVGSWDLFTGLFKSLFFGTAIALISCHRGFRCDAGAEGVGRAATAAFVYSFVAILVLDLFLGMGLDSVYFMFWPEGVKLL